MRRFLAAIRFLTVLPVPGTIGSAEGDLAGSVPLFPIVGLLLGAVAAAAGLGLGASTGAADARIGGAGRAAAGLFRLRCTWTA